MPGDLIYTKKETTKTTEICISLSIQYTNTLSSKVKKENKDRIYLILNKILRNYYTMVADWNLDTATGRRYFRNREASSRLVQGTVKPKAEIK